MHGAVVLKFVAVVGGVGPPERSRGMLGDGSVREPMGGSFEAVTLQDPGEDLLEQSTHWNW